jgi:hypothetical protein
MGRAIFDLMTMLACEQRRRSSNRARLAWWAKKWAINGDTLNETEAKSLEANDGRQDSDLRPTGYEFKEGQSLGTLVTTNDQLLPSTNSFKSPLQNRRFLRYREVLRVQLSAAVCDD